MWTVLHARLHATLRQRQLLAAGSPLLVAVSGGQDSLCLIKLLLDLQPKWQWKIAIAHCDHRWRTDGGIATHVRTLAQTWNLPFYLKVAPEIQETEAAAREWRYRALREVARQGEFPAIATGHTQSDRAETLLYNLMRGAGGDGLQALTWKRPLTAGIELVRPLLNVSRCETLQFCQQFQLPIWEDAANENPKYARNRIRRELLPYLKTHFNPQVEAHLAQTAELLRAEVEYLEGIAQTVFKTAFQTDPPRLNRPHLRRVPLAIQRRVLRHFLSKILNQAAHFDQVEACLSLVEAPNRTRTSSLPGGAIAEVQGDWIVVALRAGQEARS